VIEAAASERMPDKLSPPTSARLCSACGIIGEAAVAVSVSPPLGIRLMGFNTLGRRAYF
jgi:hypothetical protein